jgi:periplasmic protein TonB
MFEQSLLFDHAAGKKTGAMAASLTAQTLLVGILIAIPLIYSDRLPDVRLFIPLSLPLPPPPAPHHAQSAASSTSHNMFAQARVYAPTHVSDLSKLPDIAVVEGAPALTSGSDAGVPGGLGTAPFLQFVHEPVMQPKPHVAEPAPLPATPHKVGGEVQAAKLVKKVTPLYPQMARQVRVSGTVELIGVIAKDGTIQQLQVVSGHPLLVKAALDAVRQWIYSPTLLNGQAVEVIAPISVHFTLSQP